MRRRVVPVTGGLCATLVLIVTVLSGCGAPHGVDGDLTNDWPALPTATIVAPAVGDCYPNHVTDSWSADVTTVPCDGDHEAETVFVGAFSTNRSSPPAGGSQLRADAYAQCQNGAGRYLGGDYHRGALQLFMLQPTQGGWDGGARWFRCDIVRFKGAYLDAVDRSAGSVRGGMAGSHPLEETCKTIDDDGDGSIVDEQLTDCANPHNAELAGLFTPPVTAWPAGADTRNRLGSQGCEAVVARYLGFSGTTIDSPYLGWEHTDFAQRQWLIGDRTIQCFVIGFKNDSTNGVRFVGSVKGIRAGKPQGWS
ncbi:septum formation family protein [Rugosimonospora africana]|uniref:Septum formation-related domain-containing protein n=1 Tax=Rugosimonospora africana TaxID=556532 RepID=A0A8J3R1F9_9ACTN|nr:septum formation family protein [Rugosimonospora africana]GIH18456.1 hypothetical protein Raf01_66280 [Rugosimonospora africana]